MPTGFANQQAGKYRNSFFYLSILLIIVALAFWPISFHLFSLKNDALNYFLPVRHMVSESYSNNILPLWSPYLNLGYPLHGDMQSGTWNPIVQLFSVFGPYTLQMLQLETILYIYLSGVGMFFLLKYFRVHPNANMLASIAFMLCGFNSDSCQFLNWIAGTSFLPFVFLFYYRCLHERTIGSAVGAATSLFFLFNCAYPADFILTMYVLAALFVWHLINVWKQEKKISISRKFVVAHLVLVILFALLCSPAIVSYMQSLPLTERGRGASYVDAMSDPLHPLLVVSHITPNAIWKMQEAWNTDSLNRNSFIGITTFILLILSFFTTFKNRLGGFAKWGLVLFLIFSFGEMGGLRILAYYGLPLMDSFRHPANARMFTIFFACLLAAFTFDAFIKNEIQDRKIKRAITIVLCMTAVIFIWSLFRPYSLFSIKVLKDIFQSAGSPINHLKAQMDSLSFSDMVLLNILLQLPFLYFSARFLLFKKNSKGVLIVSALNCFLFVMLFQPFTVIKTQTAASTQQFIDARTVKGYPLPDLTHSMAENSAGNEDYMSEMGCLALYNKKIGRSDYRITPSNLLVQNDFWFNEEFRNCVFRYPFIYKAEAIYDETKWKEAVGSDSTARWAFMETISKIHSYSRADSTKISLQTFSPNRIEGTITTNEEGQFVLMQNYYPRWKASVDGKPVTITKANVAFMSFAVPKGTHQFAFVYDGDDLRILFILSLVTLGLILLIATAKALKRSL